MLVVRLTLEFSCGRSACQAHRRVMRVSVSRRSTATLGAPDSCNAWLARGRRTDTRTPVSCAEVEACMTRAHGPAERTGGQPNDFIAMARVSLNRTIGTRSLGRGARARGGPGSPRRDRAGARGFVCGEGARVANSLVPIHPGHFCVRALTPKVQLQASQIGSAGAARANPQIAWQLQRPLYGSHRDDD